MKPGASTVLVLVAATLGCASSAPPRPASERAPSPGPSAERAPSPRPSAPWTIAVLSDLHVAVDGSIPSKLHQVVAAVIASRPRVVVVTGDFTDGNPRDLAGRILQAPRWWGAARRALEPLRAAGIPVLPVAGNHDSYLPAYRIAYAAAWRDLDRWAAPLEIWGNRQRAQGIALDAAPFSYSVDVDGVHLVLAHIVDASLDPAVARWTAGELATARGARLRLVFGHVPVSSIVVEPRRPVVTQLGGILAAGHADLYVAGHEHLVWDDDVALAGGASLRQLLVGTASAPWQFGPSADARRRAQCVDRDSRLRCIMPHGGAPFELRRERDRWLEPQPYTFTLITIYGRAIIARALAVDDRGQAVPFGAGAMTPER
jgi:predicted MPP superfamily phosphohydrolase